MLCKKNNLRALLPFLKTRYVLINSTLAPEPNFFAIQFLLNCQKQIILQFLFLTKYRIEMLIFLTILYHYLSYNKINQTKCYKQSNITFRLSFHCSFRWCTLFCSLFCALKPFFWWILIGC